MPFAINDGVRIHYEVEGQGEPLAMIHGFSATLEMWREMGYTAPLADSYRLLLIDPRGHGRSDKPHDPGQYRPELMVGDVVAVLDHLGVEKANYLGASMGAAIGFQVARHSLNRFRSLILLAYGRFGPLSEAQRQFQAMGRRIQEMAASLPPEAALAAIEKMVGPRSPEDRARFLANDQKALLAFLESFDSWPGFEDLLPGVTVPSLVMAAEGDPHYASAAKDAGLMPGATFVALAGGLHSLDSYSTEAVVPRIKKFLGEASGI